MGALPWRWCSRWGRRVDGRCLPAGPYFCSVPEALLQRIHIGLQLTRAQLAGGGCGLHFRGDGLLGDGHGGVGARLGAAGGPVALLGRTALPVGLQCAARFADQALFQIGLAAPGFAKGAFLAGAGAVAGTDAAPAAGAAADAPDAGLAAAGAAAAVPMPLLDSRTSTFSPLPLPAQGASWKDTLPSGPVHLLMAQTGAASARQAVAMNSCRTMLSLSPKP